MEFRRYGGPFLFRNGSAFAEYIELRGLVLWLGIVIAIFSGVWPLMFWALLLFGLTFMAEYFPKIFFGLLYFAALGAAMLLAHAMSANLYELTNLSKLNNDLVSLTISFIYNIGIVIVSIVGAREYLKKLEAAKIQAASN